MAARSGVNSLAMNGVSSIEQIFDTVHLNEFELNDDGYFWIFDAMTFCLFVCLQWRPVHGLLCVHYDKA